MGRSITSSIAAESIPPPISRFADRYDYCDLGHVWACCDYLFCAYTAAMGNGILMPPNTDRWSLGYNSKHRPFPMGPHPSSAFGLDHQRLPRAALLHEGCKQHQ